MYEVGNVVADKYRIDRMVGAGGMGIVAAATHVNLNTQVALKFLREEMTRELGLVERFLFEARASAKLKSEHICRVSDLGLLDNGTPYIVMELLQGSTLGALLKERGSIPPMMVADWMLQIALGLAEAHASGIVHRDLKPGNLFLTQRPDGTSLLKVLDFGVAKAPDSKDFSMTQTTQVIGSPGYMSPEQLRSSKHVDVRSDIWSLGIVMYQLVSGRQPFHGESITELALRVAMDPTPPLPAGMPAAFEAVIYRCLEKDPANRFPTVAALAVALVPFASPGGQALATATARVLAGTTAALTIHTAPSADSPTTLHSANGVVMPGSGHTSRRRRVVGIVTGAALGLVVGVGAMVWGGRRESAAITPATQAAPATRPPPTIAPAIPQVTPIEVAPARSSADRPHEPAPASPPPESAPPVQAGSAGASGVEPGSSPPAGHVRTKRPPRSPKPAKQPTQPSPPSEDLGESRF